MFLEFLFHLRAVGLRVTVTEWLALMRALSLGHARSDLASFYHLARAVLVKRETQYDLYDRAFASFFEGVDVQFDLTDELRKWLENPVLPRELTEAERAALKALDVETLRRRFEERLRNQKERHDGGSQHIGTGGTSPFGNGGTNPAGIRVGGQGGGRTAIEVASERRFENLRGDRVLDTRQIGSALRNLRKLARDPHDDTLDVERTVDESARNAGEIELVFGPPRRNRVKLLLLMDVGGSMEPHRVLCERLFGAASAGGHWKRFEHYFFHNYVYDRVYTNITRYEGPRTDEVLARLDATWMAVFVGDAWMSPYELGSESPQFASFPPGRFSGLQWLRKVRERVPQSVWLNPEPKRTWSEPTIRSIHRVFPMFELTLDGLGEAVDVLRGRRPNEPYVGPTFKRTY